MESAIPRKLKGIHVFYMLAGFFGVMFAVNGVFVYFALTSFSGISVQDAYKKGLSYNEEISRFEDQQARGWKTDLVVEILEDKKVFLSLTVSDKQNQKINDIGASLLVSRPAREDQDQLFTMVPTRAGFELETTFAEPGQWDLLITLKGGGFDKPYRVEKRIWVK
ncbi:FixH family protein [Sneathiella sp.]|jgi:nitrogen fixation protein FixH|uniref:FixH family protein n=1 Tax=Sneathiella sp. TaxID=1964365 RepID=UPI0039E67718